MDNKKIINKRGFWTDKNNCQKEALQYESKTEFYNKSNGAYRASKRYGWLDEVCSHMVEKRKGKDYWGVKENCHKAALEFSTRTDFHDGNRPAYSSCCVNNWLNEVCSHMIEIIKPSGYWTKERCHEEALKYNTKNEFSLGCSAAFSIAYKNKWIEDICSHMIEIIKPIGYWTKDKCREVCLKYHTKKDLINNDGGCYHAIITNRWIEELCSHMIPLGNKYKKLIYMFVFPDKSVYIGLTCYPEKRYYAHTHSIKSPVYKHIINTGLNPEYTHLSEYINVEDAILLEIEKIKYYRENGFNVLNTKNGGEIGSSVKYWTYEKCKEKSKECLTRSEFKKKYSAGYNESRINKWLDEFFPINI